MEMMVESAGMHLHDQLKVLLELKSNLLDQNVNQEEFELCIQNVDETIIYLTNLGGEKFPFSFSKELMALLQHTK